MAINRRVFLHTSITSALISFFDLPKTSADVLAKPNFGGRLLTLGAYGEVFRTEDTYTQKSRLSILTELDLSSGKYRQLKLELVDGHQVVPLDSSRLLCVPYLGPTAQIVDMTSLTVTGQLSAAEGFLFAGHAIKLNNLIYLPSKSNDSDSKNLKNGQIHIFEISSNKLVKCGDSGGIWPHDLVFLPGEEMLVVGHTGTNGPASPDQLYLYSNKKSCLTVLNAKSLDVQKIIKTPGLSPSHLAVDPAGQIYSTSVQWVRFNNDGFKFVSRDFDEKQHVFRLAHSEYEEKRLSTPEPVLVVNANSGKMVRILKDPNLQRRPVAIVYHPVAKSIFITFSHSDTLFKINCNNLTTEIVSAFELGISEIRGLYPIQNSSLLAVGGKFRGVALINALDLSVHKRYDVPLFYSTHLTHLV